LKQRLLSKKTLVQEANYEELQAALCRRIEKWRETQALYMPGVSELQSSDDCDSAESIPLYLPSSLPASLRLSLATSLQDREQRLRLAQVQDSLTELRRLLRIMLGLRDYKHTQVGYRQKANTRARALIARYQEKVNRCADRYRAGWQALQSLDCTGSWTEQFLELKVEDVRPPMRNVDESEGRRQVSWIWMVKPDSNIHVMDDETDIDEGEKFHCHMN
jgi:hypothetical protein